MLRGERGEGGDMAKKNRIIQVICQNIFNLGQVWMRKDPSRYRGYKRDTGIHVHPVHVPSNICPVERKLCGKWWECDMRMQHL